MDYVADTDTNPFGMDPPCERSVPGYGDTAADFHVVGDSPAVHGGVDTGIPFTGRSWSVDFFDTLARAGLVAHSDHDGRGIELEDTFLSYLCMCDTGDSVPTESDYAAVEPFFDAELRAITAHVLLPVGERATAHVLDTYTARSDQVDMDALHATRVRGSGWLVVPIGEPATWDPDDADALVETLAELQRGDYRQTADLGRFLPDSESHLVR